MHQSRPAADNTSLIKEGGGEHSPPITSLPPHLSFFILSPPPRSRLPPHNLLRATIRSAAGITLSEPLTSESHRGLIEDNERRLIIITTEKKWEKRQQVKLLFCAARPLGKKKNSHLGRL